LALTHNPHLRPMLTTICLLAILFLAVNGQIFPALLNQLGGTSLQQGLLMSALFLLFPLSSVLSGYLADRSSKQLLIALGMMAITLAFVLSALFDSIRDRTLSVSLIGIGGGTVESQTSALLTDSNPKRERKIMNLSQTFFSIGAAGGPFLITLVYHIKSDLSLKAILWGATGAPALLTLAFLFLRKRKGSVETLPPSQIFNMLRVKGFWVLIALIFLYVAAEMGTAGWLAKYGVLHLGLDERLAPICMTVFWAGLGVSRGVLGLMHWRISDRQLLSLSLLFTFVLQVLSFLLQNVIFSLIGIGLIGFGMGVVWPTLVAMAGARFRKSSGTAVGILIAAGGLGIPLVQPLVGLLSNPAILGLRFTLLSLSTLTLMELLILHFGLRREN